MNNAATITRQARRDVQTIALWVTAFSTDREYPVRFYGERAEDNALAFIARRNDGDHHIVERPDEPIDPKFGRLLEALYPRCPHGLSADSCYGPQHYWYDEEEQARGFTNGW